MPSDPKYNFLADPMRSNDYIEPEHNDSATLNNRKFNSGSNEDKVDIDLIKKKYYFSKVLNFRV